MHAQSQVLPILMKRLREELHSRAIHAGERAVDAVVNDVTKTCKGIPQSERIAPRRAEEHTFDLTMALAFVANPVRHDQMIGMAKSYMPEVVSSAEPYVLVEVPTVLRQSATIHKLWHQKAFFSDHKVL